MVDRPDDLKIGIRSSAITFGRFDVWMVMFFYAAMLTVMRYIGAILGFNQVYYLGLIGAALVACYHYILIKNRQPERCFKAFLHNNWVGALIFAGIFFNYL
jgi:4-hydroxybenzoate polyprenyltransferase